MDSPWVRRVVDIWSMLRNWGISFISGRHYYSLLTGGSWTVHLTPDGTGDYPDLEAAVLNKGTCTDGCRRD